MLARRKPYLQYKQDRDQFRRRYTPSEKKKTRNLCPGQILSIPDSKISELTLLGALRVILLGDRLPEGRRESIACLAKRHEGTSAKEGRRALSERGQYHPN